MRHTVNRSSTCTGIAALVFVLTMAAGITGCADGSLMSEPDRPNIVFIIADDLRWNELSCTGHPYAKTPHIDRLAREGTIFSRFFVVTPLCSPSRASFMTGQYPRQHRIINNDKHGLDVVSHRLMTFPRILREEAGYETAFIGKWHMGFDDSRRPGFDHWISFKGQGQYIDPVLNVNGLQEQRTGYVTDDLNEEAVAFITKSRSRPFCLYVSHKGVHFPYIPAKRHEPLYEPLDYIAPETTAGDLAGKPVLARRSGGGERPLWRDVRDSTPEPAEPRRGRGRDPSSIVRDRMRCLASIDDGVGMVYSALERAGVLDKTIVIFTSDNGYLLGEHGEFDTKRWAYDECLRVPMIVRYPPLAATEAEINRLVLSVDVAPTLLAAAGVRWSGPMAGRSFLPLFNDDQAPWRTSFIAEYFLEEIVPAVPDWLAVRTETTKYIHYPADETLDEFYDLSADPREMRNLIDHSSAAAALEASRRELAAYHR